MSKEEAKWLIVITLLTLGWFFRYDFQVVQTGGQGNTAVAYMLNRWTGSVYLVYPRGIRELEAEPKVADFSSQGTPAK